MQNEYVSKKKKQKKQTSFYILDQQKFKSHKGLKNKVYRTRKQSKEREKLEDSFLIREPVHVFQHPNIGNSRKKNNNKVKHKEVNQ